MSDTIITSYTMAALPPPGAVGRLAFVTDGGGLWIDNGRSWLPINPNSGIFNVKAFGAQGNGQPADDIAIRQAIEAANQSTGIVYFPPGNYILSTSQDLKPGVSIQGAGIGATTILIQIPDPAAAAFTWSNATAYGIGGFVRDIVLEAQASPSGDPSSLVGTIVALNNMGDFYIRNARILYASNNGLHIHSGIHSSIENVVIGGGGTSGAAGVLVDGGTTTIAFGNCYFSDVAGGPGADVTGVGISFVNCIFESNGVNVNTGFTDPVNGVGILVRSGTVSLFSPYFEDNAGYDMVFGSEGVTHIAVINPTIRGGAYKAAGKGGALIDKVTGGVFLGGDYSQVQGSLTFTASGYGVTALGIDSGPNPPQFPDSASMPPNNSSPGCIDNYEGMIQFVDPASGSLLTSGNYGLVIGGGALISNHLSAVLGTEWNPGTLQPGACANVSLSVAGAAPGDAVAVGFTGIGQNSASLLSAQVSQTGTVEVVLYNAGGAPQAYAPGVLRVDVWKHAPNPCLSISPPSGLKGSTVLIVGTRYGANEQVTVKWDCGFQACSSTTVLATPTTDLNGGFSVSVQIPPSAVAGAYTILGQGRTSGDFTTISYLVTG